MTLMEWAIDVPQELLQSDAILTMIISFPSAALASAGGLKRNLNYIDKEELNIKESYTRIVVCNSAT